MEMNGEHQIRDHWLILEFHMNGVVMIFFWKGEVVMIIEKEKSTIFLTCLLKSMHSI